MLGWFRALMPKEDRFFGLFDAHAQTLVDGAAALRDLLAGGTGVTEACRTIAMHEEAADQITRDALLAVRRSCITPFDRSDIQALVSTLDDTIDQMQKTAKAVQLFEVTHCAPPMQEMGAEHAGEPVEERRCVVPRDRGAEACRRKPVVQVMEHHPRAATRHTSSTRPTATSMNSVRMMLICRVCPAAAGSWQAR